MRREFPDRPIVGVGGVVIHRGRVLLIRRGQEPLKGEWSIPGGMVELGEDLRSGVQRELEEETGIKVEPVETIAIFDRIERRGSRVRYHYVMVDYACRKIGGVLRPASDVLEARWVRPQDLAPYHLTEKAAEVVCKGIEFFRKRRRC